MLSRRTLSMGLLRSAPVRLAPARLLHASRPALSEASVGGAVAESATFKKISKNNVHVLDSATLNTWQEIPKGGLHGSDRSKAIWSIWYNHAIIPLYAVSIIAACLSTWFMYRYFSRHTEITWSKAMRATYDHQGLDDRRANSHDNRLLYPGAMHRNKKEVTVFPFNYVPKEMIVARHKVDYVSEQ
jgi:hypothetical protein